MSEQETTPVEESAENSTSPSQPNPPAAPKPAAPPKSSQSAKSSRYNDDDDDDYDDYEDYDDEEEEEELDARGRFGVPSDYVPSTQRGRSRRIHIDIKLEDLHYKNIPLLTRFLDTRGRILSRRKTGVSAKIQRKAVTAIKRARHLALLPYTAEHTRVTRLKKRG
ncbi:MAG: 30S ribosomal protein S18 [Caldilineaceae bacterium]|nr:30S ribosomal protein S18 [Caldilineaceae bacterium]